MSQADTNVHAFLTTIKVCEGVPLGPEGYQILFGWPKAGRTFTSSADHPRKKFQFTQTDGKLNWSTAAGAYQIIAPTFDRVQKKLGKAIIPDFSPSSQDRIAMELIAEDGAMGDVKDGRLAAAIEKCGGTWASMPSSRYPQPKRTFEFAKAAFIKAGGTLA